MLRAFESRKKLLAQNEEKKIFYRDKLQEFESTKKLRKEANGPGLKNE